MEDLKRMRTANWSEQDKIVLRTLVLERADIIEKKDASTNTNAAKKLAWEEVLSRFNAISVNKRTTTQILNQWRNMKNNAKKTEFAYRRARTMTGGEPPPPSPPAEDRKLIDTIPNEFAVDSNDSIYAKQLETSQTKRMRPSVSPRASTNQRKKKNKPDCCRESHEHQLFVLAKTAREEAMIREKEAHECKMRDERELHERKLTLMHLEEDYWKAKIMNLK